MKKLMFLGLILTLFSVAVSAQQASGESYRHHRIEEGYRKGESGRPEMRRTYRDHRQMRMERHRNFRDGRMNRFDHHRIHRMHRHERRHFRHNRHHVI